MLFLPLKVLVADNPWPYIFTVDTLTAKSPSNKSSVFAAAIVNLSLTPDAVAIVRH